MGIICMLAMDTRRFWVVAGLIVLVALGARLGIALSLRPWTPSYERLYVFGDPRVYHELASELATTGSWSEGSRWRVSVFAPGYPVFLSFIYRIFGINIPAAVFINCVLSALSCLLMIVLVRTGIGERAALIAGGLFALHPHGIRFTPLLYSETLFMFLSTCLLTAFVLGERATKNAKWSWFWGVIVASLFAAATVPTRLGMLYFAPVGALLWYLFTTSHWRLGLVRWAVFLLLFLTWLAPWALHNKSRYDTYRLSVSGEYNFLALFVAGGLSADGESARQLAKELLQEAQRRARADGVQNHFEMAPYYLALAREKIQENPLHFLKASVIGFFNFWFRAIMLGSDERGAHLKQDLKTKIYVYYSWIFQLVLFVAWIVVLFSWRSMPKAWLLLAATSVVYFSLVVGNSGYSRFFLQALPFILPSISIVIDKYIFLKRNS